MALPPLPSRRARRSFCCLSLGFCLGELGCTEYAWKYDTTDPDAAAQAGAAGGLGLGVGRGGSKGGRSGMGESNGGHAGAAVSGAAGSSGPSGSGGHAGSGGAVGGPLPQYLNVTAALIDESASENARRLMHYLRDNYGKSILSGQQGLEYVPTVLSLTGKEPAVLGLDLMDYSPSRVERGSSSQAAEEGIDWWRRRGGIVTMVWHWNAPSKLVDQPGKEWWRGFYTDATSFDLAAAMSDPSSQDYLNILRDIDAIAAPLAQLSDAGVPVLFRPLHEASGGWFWWGAKGSGPYLALWNLIYTRLTVDHDLHHLIWVWNGQAGSWYPGDDRVDIVSEDIYSTRRVYTAEHAKFSAAVRYSGSPKLIALSENGVLPDPDQLVQRRAAWSWFCVWSGNDFILDELWNENWMKHAVYAHDYVISLDELPALGAYPLP